MFEAELKSFPKVGVNISHLNTQSTQLADEVAATVTNYTKIALVSFSKIATGGTLRSIHWRSVQDRSAAMFGAASHGIHKRQVVADRSFFFIQSGRRAGAKMPVRMIGTGPRGGKLFEPLPALVRWFNALAIPRSAWFPILRAIKARGIRPTPVAQRAVTMAMPAVQAQAQAAAVRISVGLIKNAS